MQQCRNIVNLCQKEMCRTYCISFTVCSHPSIVSISRNHLHTGLERRSQYPVIGQNPSFRGCYFQSSGLSTDLYHDKCQTPRRFFCSSNAQFCLRKVLPGKIDRYQGVWIDLTSPTASDLTEQEFDNLLKASLQSWKQEGLTSAWLHIPMTQGKYFTVASRYGFTFHHAEGDRATLSLWMGNTQESKIPRFASHQVGVSGIVMKEDSKEVLVVQDKNRPYQLWKFPGGLSDLGEDIAMTAEREVFEETGLRTEFQSVLAFRQQHEQPGAFGRSDLYFICRLKPLTFELNPCEEEIAACQWMSVYQLREEVHASSITHRLADLVLRGMEHGFDQVDITSSQMKSIYKGLKFHLFHRPLKQNI